MQDYMQTQDETTVTVSLLNSDENKSKNWMERLLALGAFIQQHTPGQHVSVYAYEDEHIGGLRIQEISFTNGPSGSSYMRCEHDHWPMIVICEEFCATYGIEPYRPDGWQSFINNHGEARIAILKELGYDAEADAEYRQQLEHEATLT